MVHFIYDGSFEGLLTAAFDIYDRKVKSPHTIAQKNFQPDMFGESVKVYTDATKANRVWKGLQRKVSVKSLVNVYSVYLSELPEMEETLLSFCKEVFGTEQNVEENYSSHAILRVAQIGRQLFREKHRFEAFIRFQKLQDGSFYATIEPDFNVIPLITAHFVRRYADQEWIIFDVRRQYGIHYDLKQVQEVYFDFQQTNRYGEAPEESFDLQEDLYQLLWKVYFKNVNIPARRNMKLHKKHVPVRYWKYLIEKQPDL